MTPQLFCMNLVLKVGPKTGMRLSWSAQKPIWDERCRSGLNQKDVTIFVTLLT